MLFGGFLLFLYGFNTLTTIMQLQISEALNGIIKYAREEAMRTGSYGIGPDHLFLGIIRHEDNDAFRVLQGLGVEPAELKGFIDSRIFTNETIPYDQIEHINFSRQAQNVLSITIMEATRMKSEEAAPHHLLLALCRTTESYGQAFLRARGIDYGRLLSFMEDEGMLHPKDATPREQQPVQGPVEETGGAEGKELDIEEFGYDLTRAAREGKLDPVVGRDAEISRVIEILGRRKKNNPMLIGDPGVGKSAIVEGIALRIASGDISAALLKKRILSLDIASVVAGTKYRGDFEKRLKGIIKEAPVLDLVSIKIGDDEYRNVSGEMMKVMASSPKGFITLEQVGDIEMNIDAKLRYRPEVSNNGESSQAFKTPSQVKSNVVTIADILIPIGKTPKALKDAAGNDPTEIELKSEFYVHTDGFNCPATKKAFTETIPAERADEWKAWSKKNKIKWRDPQSLLLLVDFVK